MMILGTATDAGAASLWPWLGSIEVTGDGVGAAAGIGTLIVAIFVFVEARKIRRTEWILRQNQAWNDLGNKVAELERGSRIGKMLLGEAIEPPLNPKEAFLLMSFFNVVSSEFHAYQVKAMHTSYVIHSLTMTQRIVVANKSWIFEFLRKYGYEHAFIRAIAVLVVMGDDIRMRDWSLKRELLAISRLGNFCGPRFRAWLRKEFRNDEIDALCHPDGL